MCASLLLSRPKNEFFTGRICGMCLKVNSVKPVAGNNDPNPFPATPFIVYINDVCTRIPPLTQCVYTLTSIQA